MADKITHEQVRTWLSLDYETGLFTRLITRPIHQSDGFQ